MIKKVPDELLADVSSAAGKPIVCLCYCSCNVYDSYNHSWNADYFSYYGPQKPGT